METIKIKLSEVIDDIAAGPFGSNLKVSCFVDHGFPIIDGANLKEYKVTDNITKFVTEEKARSLHRSIAKRGDIVVTISGTLGQIAYIPTDSKFKEYLCSQRQFRVTFNSEKVYPPYLVFFFHTWEGQHKILAFANQTGVPALSQPLKNFKNIIIELPNIEIQKKIASFCEMLNNKIEQNNKINKNLQSQALAIYIHMIVKKADESWHTGLLSDIASITMGQSPKGDSYNENGIGTVFFQGRAEFSFRFPSRRLYTTEPKRMAKANDILMSVRAPVGDLNVAYEDCCIGRGLSAIHSKDNHQSFVLYTMFVLRQQLDVFNGEGTVFGSINRDALNSIPISIPPHKVMDKFESIVAPMDAIIRINYEENCRLQAMRDSLLPRLMSGELDISALNI